MNGKKPINQIVKNARGKKYMSQCCKFLAMARESSPMTAVLIEGWYPLQKLSYLKLFLHGVHGTETVL